MGILNRILCVLILLAAIGAAVLSYFLFEKRQQMLKGWEQMAVIINQTSAVLDEKSGTKVAEKLKKDNLDHKLPLAELQTALNNLKEQAKKVASQRNSLASTLVSVAGTLDVSQGDEVALMNVDKSASSQDALKSAAAQIKTRNEAILNNFVSAGTLVGIQSSPDAIKGDTGSGLLSGITGEVQKRDNKIASLKGGMVNIAGTVGVGVGASAFDEGRYIGTIAGIVSGVKAQKAKLNETVGALRTAQNNIRTLNSSVNQLRNQVAENQKTIAVKQKQIDDLYHQLNPTNDKEIHEKIFGKIKPASLYALVRGQVKRVDDKWGFVVVDLGTFYNVKETIAGKQFNTLVPIQPGKVMTVVRGLETDKPQYVAKVVLSEVQHNYTIANVDLSSAKSEVRPGDVVIFLNKDILDGGLDKIDITANN